MIRVERRTERERERGRERETVLTKITRAFRDNVNAPKNSTFLPQSAFMCFVWVSEQTAIINLYSSKSLVFITETESAYCVVRTYV